MAVLKRIKKYIPGLKTRGIFLHPPPQKKPLTQYFLKGPIKVLECVDIIFLGQFDVPEHVFNIGLMMRPLLEALWLLRKYFSHTKMPQNGLIWAPKALL